ncbi:hypothetical protein QBB34_44795 [Streptomyces stelliscabiei]
MTEGLSGLTAGQPLTKIFIDLLGRERVIAMIAGVSPGGRPPACHAPL